MSTRVCVYACDVMMVTRKKEVHALSLSLSQSQSHRLLVSKVDIMNVKPKSTPCTDIRFARFELFVT